MSTTQRRRSAKAWRSSGLALVVLLCALGARGAAAAGEDDGESPAVKQAREHYRLGEAAFRVGDFERARSEFESGYALVPRPGFLLNMAHSERRLGRLRNARALYKRYLLADPESKQRDEVLGLIAKLDGAIADEEKASAEARDAEARPAEPPPAPAAPPAPAHAPAVPAAVPPAGDGEVTPAATLGVRAPEPGERPSGAPFYTRWWFWGVVGAVAVGVAAGAVLATRGSPTYHDDGSLGRLGNP
jgi:tetratricopeptide (TPR) repeat protein